MRNLNLPPQILGELMLVNSSHATIARLAGGILLIPALLQCFFGYRIFKLWISFIGFLLGGIIGASIWSFMLNEAGGTIVLVMLFLSFGVLGAIVARKVFLVGVFLHCFSTGLVFGGILGSLIENFNFTWQLGVVFGIILGIIGIIFVKHVLIISTAFSGGLLGGLSLSYLVGDGISYIAAIMLISLGIYVQYRDDAKASQRT